ncbi:MAG: hypothetical protein JXO48_04955 [Deltaproteobacteria bacterium]|nr:hypothetical protein [Deltaproteobacteria bacterium]
MSDKGYEKTQEEILKERAEVLFRTGRMLSDAINRARDIEKDIDEKMNMLNDRVRNGYVDSINGLCRDIDEQINQFNEAREYAKIRYYYLIVTREAMGFRRHAWVENIYRIPNKKKNLKRNQWTGMQNEG